MLPMPLTSKSSELKMWYGNDNCAVSSLSVRRGRGIIMLPRSPKERKYATPCWRRSYLKISRDALSGSEKSESVAPNSFKDIRKTKSRKTEV